MARRKHKRPRIPESEIRMATGTGRKAHACITGSKITVRKTRRGNRRTAAIGASAEKAADRLLAGFPKTLLH